MSQLCQQRTPPCPEHVPDPDAQEIARSLQTACGAPTRPPTQAATEGSGGSRLTGRLPALRDGSVPDQELGLDNPHESRRTTLPVLLTVDEAADLLRTTRRAIYAMIERRQLPGVIRVRRRVLLRADDLLDWLDQKRAPSPEE